MAEAEGGLSQSALVRRLIRNAARERGIWPPDQHRIASELAPDVINASRNVPSVRVRVISRSSQLAIFSIAGGTWATAAGFSVKRSRSTD